MHKTILIFDFDGTIADTHSYIVDISNRLSEEFNYNLIRVEEKEKLKDKTSQEIIRYLRIPVFRIPSILSKAKKEYYNGIATIHPISGLKETLHELKKVGVTMGIFSSNTQESIHKFLKNHHLDIFDFIKTTSSVWSKNTTFKKLLLENGYRAQQIIYICDEVRDITAVKKCGIKVAAVSWGYNSVRTLKKHKPDFLINKPADLLKLCS